MTEAKPLSTPGVKHSDSEQDIEDAVSLDNSRGTKYRRAAAILNYIAQDRPDLQFAAKECSRKMSCPNELDERNLKRVLRYLRLCPRLPYRYVWQRMPSRCVTHSDSDWAGCTRTRRSTSGGVCSLGLHTIKTWSRTQATVSLSSAEAELGSLVKASTETLGLIALAADADVLIGGAVHTDSSAARAIALRKGCGKVKHIRTQQLWIQEAAASGTLSFMKVPRADNAADMMTHHWDASEGRRFMLRLSIGPATQ